MSLSQQEQTYPFLILQNDIQCPPQLVAKIFQHRQIRYEVVYSYYPSVFEYLKPTDYKGIVVLGGRMGSYEEAEYPWLITLKKFLLSALEEEVPIFGICLGSQILAHVIGGDVFPGPKGSEYGFETNWNYNNESSLLTKDPVIKVIYENDLSQYMILSHDDTFVLPKEFIIGKKNDNKKTLEVVLLASTKKYPTIYRVGKYTYGFQTHPDCDHELHQLWLSSNRVYLPKKGFNYDTIVSVSKRNNDKICHTNGIILNSWVDLCLNKSQNLKNKNKNNNNSNNSNNNNNNNVRVRPRL